MKGVLVTMVIKIKKSSTSRQPYYLVFYAKGNHEPLLRSSEMYATKAAAKHAAELVKTQAGSATIVDDTARSYSW
jgi:uncharacterized protein YegP (UPF0339 family)